MDELTETFKMLLVGSFLDSKLFQNKKHVEESKILHQKIAIRVTIGIRQGETVKNGKW